MNAFKLYLNLSLVSINVGLGMFLGANLADGTSNTPYWIGGILVLGGAVLLGMAISTRNSSTNTKPEDEITPQQ